MKFKSLAAAALVAMSAVSAHALTFSLGTIGSAPLGNSAITGAFTDTYTFTLAGPSSVYADATNTATLIAPSFSVGEILGFSAWLDLAPLSLSTVSTPLAPGVDEKKQLLLTAPPMTLAAGTHTLTISGTGATLGTSSYAGVITATPVPEPETYAMMLAGLGALSFLARRRQQG